MTYITHKSGFPAEALNEDLLRQLRANVEWYSQINTTTPFQEWLEMQIAYLETNYDDSDGTTFSEPDVDFLIKYGYAVLNGLI